MKKSLVVLFCALVLTMGLSAGEKQKSCIGSFPLCQKIGTGQMGAVSFTTHLIVDVCRQTMTGYGNIFQPVSPPVSVPLKLEGHYSIIVFGSTTHTVVHLTGYQDLHTGSGTIKVIKLRASMLLSGWQSGVCTYKYLNDRGKWIKVKSVPVKSFPCFPPAKVDAKQDGAIFWAYISPQNHTAECLTYWKVTISQGNWAGSISSADPYKQLYTPGLSGIFKVEVVASGRNFSKKVLAPKPGTQPGVIGCNSNCHAMVGIVANEGCTDAQYWTVWDAFCD